MAAGRTLHTLSNAWKSPGQFSRLAARSEPVHAKKSSPANGSESRTNIFTDSDFLRSFWGTGLLLRGGRSPSSSSAMEAALARGVVTVKSSSNMERGDTESESNLNRVPTESPSRARALLAERGDAVVSSGSNANLEGGWESYPLQTLL